MSEKNLRKNLYASFKKRAIYKRGLEVGKALSRHAPSDMEGIKNAFLTLDPDEGRMFSAEVLRSDAQGVDIRFNRCPLKEAWQEAGLSDKETAKICAIAARVDNGTFEGAGVAFY